MSKLKKWLLLRDSRLRAVCRMGASGEEEVSAVGRRADVRICLVGRCEVGMAFDFIQWPLKLCIRTGCIVRPDERISVAEPDVDDELGPGAY